MTYRPLIGGIGIFNPAIRRIGTLGMIVHDPVSDKRWMISASHVLVPGPSDGDAASYEIFQPIDGMPPVAMQHPEMVDLNLDCAAALIEPTIQSEESIVEIPFLNSLAVAVEGVRVIKSGYATGVTEGIIRRVNGDQVEIESPPTYPVEYELSEQGDSGAIWLERSTCSPVAMHVRGNTTGVERAYAIRIQAVFNALDLPLV